MAKKKKSYWEKRAAERERSYQEGSRKTVEDVQKIYDKAFDNINVKLEKLKKKIDKLEDGEAAYYLERSGMLKQIQDGVYDELRKVADIERRQTAAHYKTVMSDAYYKTVFDIQRGTGFRYSFALLPTRAVNAALESVWLNHNYSKSVWKNTAKVAMHAEEIITSGLLSGAGIKEMTGQLDSVMGVGQRVAERLIRTEVNYFSNQGELDAYKESGISQYEFLATLDLRTSELCRELDGKIFDADKAEVGVNYPPMHPWCRSTTVAVIDGGVTEGLQRRARDPTTGKTYLVPADTDYGTWYKNNVDGSRPAKAAE